MADTIMLVNSTPLDTQAETHQTLAEHISWIKSTHHPYGDAFSATTTASGMPDLHETYAQWWDSFSSHLEAQGNAHQGMARSLGGIVDGFQNIDNSAASAV